MQYFTPTFLFRSKHLQLSYFSFIPCRSTFCSVYCRLQLILGSECRTYKTADCEITIHSETPFSPPPSRFDLSEYYTRRKPGLFIATEWGLGETSCHPAPRLKLGLFPQTDDVHGIDWQKANVYGGLLNQRI